MSLNYRLVRRPDMRKDAAEGSKLYYAQVRSLKKLKFEKFCNMVAVRSSAFVGDVKLVIDGIQVPAGEIYVSHEAPNGELGFYLISDGSGRPYKLHVRSPSFAHMGGMHTLLEGYQVADVIATFGSMNMIGGECDR